MRAGRGTRVLYISHDGLMEPLGQSQILQYVKGLASQHEIFLVTLEKGRDLDNRPEFLRFKEIARNSGFRWIPLRYHTWPRGPATAYDLARAYWECQRIVRKHHIDVVHARSYIPALLAARLKRHSGARFLFDIRGFWPDQRVDGGSWSRWTPYYRLFKRWEGRLFREADAVVSLTQAAVQEIQTWDHLGPAVRHFEVIPTCVDLRRFRRKGPLAKDPVTLCWSGSVGTLYCFEEALELFQAFRTHRPNARLLILNRRQHPEIHRALARSGLPTSAYELREVSPDDMPKALAEASVGLVLCRDAYSLKAAAPTKLGEFLAMGIPCVSHRSTGDASLLLQHAGAVLQGYDQEDLEAVTGALLKLVEDPQTPGRCREVAELHFDLERGIAAYDRLYRKFAGAG